MRRRNILALSTAAIAVILASVYLGTVTNPMYRMHFETTLYRDGATPKESSQAGISIVVTQDEKMTIFNGYLSLEVDNIESPMAEVTGLAQKLGGYVASSQISTYGSRITGYIAIRVPRSRFQEAVSKISLLGKVIDQRTSSDDVTERYIDLKARLANFQRQEKRLQELLSKAATVTDVLAVERELERVRGQIESLQGQINYLERNVEMSLISVRFTEAPPWFTPPGMDWGETLETAIRILFLVIRGLIILIVAIIPFALLAILAFLVYRKRRGTRAT